MSGILFVSRNQGLRQVHCISAVALAMAGYRTKIMVPGEAQVRWAMADLERAITWNDAFVTKYHSNGFDVAADDATGEVRVVVRGGQLLGEQIDTIVEDREWTAEREVEG